MTPEKTKFCNEYLQKYNSQEPSNYDRRPAILDYLTYIEKDKKSGKWYRRRLSPHDKELYMIFKQRAGRQNKCWTTQANLAAHAGISEKNVISGKKALSQTFEQLDGMALITVEEKQTGTYNEDRTKLKNKKRQHIITIEDIWCFNNAWPVLNDYQFPPMSQEISEKEAEIAIEKMRHAAQEIHVYKSQAKCKYTPSQDSSVQNCIKPTREHSANLPCKQITKETDDIVKETNYNGSGGSPPSAVQICLLKEDLSSCFSSEHKATKWLERFGIASHARKDLKIAGNLPQLLATAQYLLHMVNKNPNKSNLAGYFIQAFNKKWYYAEN